MLRDAADDACECRGEHLLLGLSCMVYGRMHHITYVYQRILTYAYQHELALAPLSSTSANAKAPVVVTLLA